MNGDGPIDFRLRVDLAFVQALSTTISKMSLSVFLRKLLTMLNYLEFFSGVYRVERNGTGTGQVSEGGFLDR